MQIDLKQFKDIYLLESSEHVAEMESALLSLRSAPQDIGLLNAIFRTAHSIKGAAGTFGLTEVVRFTHSLESLLDRLRAGELLATPEMISLLLRSKDVLTSLLAETTPPETEEVLAALNGALAGISKSSGDKRSNKNERTTVVRAEVGAVETGKRFRIHFHPSREILMTGCNPLLLLRNIGELGEVLETILHDHELPRIEELDPLKCYLGWTCVLRTACPADTIREVFEFVEGDAEIRIEPLEEDSCASRAVSGSAPGTAKLTEIAKSGTTAKPSPLEAASVRVSTEKLDKLINLVGEMVIANAMVLQIVENFSAQDLPRLRESAQALGRHTREIHERIMSVRMLPVGSLFARFQRMVHDLAAKTGKSIQLRTSGEETEVDKSMLEQLSDPLTHLIRNSCDHGLETAEERRTAGKPEIGTIGLHAYHRAGQVVIEVSDDGKGLNLDRIREKAVQSGLISANVDLSREQIQMLIFEAGFSTRDQVSDLSGRGVGMDVVKQNIKALSGSIELASETGQGTRIRLQVPLTLAIMDGLIVRVGPQSFVLPMLGILETISLKPESIRAIPGHGEVGLVRGEPVPVLHLDRLFQISGRPKAGSRRLGVVVEQGTTRMILVVDELLGQQQVVIKSLEQNFRRIEGAMGATILGDGRAAIILDISALVQTNLSSLCGSELVA